MPMIHAIVPEPDSHVYMPVFNQVAHHLIDTLNLNSYIQDNILIETGWTTPRGTRKNHTFFTRTNTLKITAEQSPVMNPVFDFQSFEFAGGHGFNKRTVETHLNPLLADTTADIFLSESILPASFTLNCSLWFTSRNTAYEAMKRLIYSYTNEVFQTLSITYDYPLPKEITSLLFNLFLHRKYDAYDHLFKDYWEAQKPVTFKDWLSRVAKARFVTTKHRARKDKELCISKYIDNMLYVLNCDVGKPEEQRVNNVPEVYSIPFTVKIQFEEASAVVVQYPVIVDNTQLNLDLIPVPRRDLTPIASQWPRRLNPLWNGSYHIHSAVHCFPNGAIQIPYYDDWKAPWNDFQHRSYLPFFISLFQADKDGTYLSLDLKDYLYEDYHLGDFTKFVLEQQLNESFRADVIFAIAPYMRNRIQSPANCNLSKDLILSIKAQDIHPQRHLVFYELFDFRYLNPKWYWILKEYPEQFCDPNAKDPFLDYIKGLEGDGPLDPTGVYGGNNHGTARRAIRIFYTAIIPKGARSR